MTYYERILSEIDSLGQLPCVRKEVVGYSEFGQPIHALYVSGGGADYGESGAVNGESGADGNGAEVGERAVKSEAVQAESENAIGEDGSSQNFFERANLALVGGVHAREWYTCLLLCALCRRYCGFFEKPSQANSRQTHTERSMPTQTNARKNPSATLIPTQSITCKNPSVRFVPMCNPDGVRLATEGAAWVENSERERLIRINGGSDFSLWKANGRGVDINVNFDARWGEGEGNVTHPAPSGYIGEFPASESETRAMMAVGLAADAVLCYHTKGEMVYYGFDGDETALPLATKLGGVLGYSVASTPNSTGGFKDWLVINGVPNSLTIEVGNDAFKHPILLFTLPKEVDKHWIALLVANGELKWQASAAAAALRLNRKKVTPK